MILSERRYPPPERCPGVGFSDHTLKEPNRLASRAGLEARFGAAVRDVDDMDRTVALAGDEQFVAAERHVHGLRADPDGGLLPERRIDQAHGVAVEAGDADQAVVGRVAR